MNDIYNVFKKSWLIPAILICVAGIVIVQKFDLSFTDHIANKVIQKLEADYSPYGPNGKPSE